MSSEVLVQSASEVIGRQLKPFPEQEPYVVASLGYKGGIGKTTLAEEVAQELDAVAVDLDWSKGGLTAGWGYREEERQGAPLLEAFESGKVPVPLRGGDRKPDLIPGHTTFGENEPSAEKVADDLLRWSKELKRRLVVDTHPDACPSTYGAMAAANVVLTPVVLKVREMRSLEQLLEEASDYPLLLVPYMVDGAPSEQLINELESMAKKYQVAVGPMVSYYKWIGVRRKRVAICSEPIFKKEEPFVEQIREVAKAALNYAR
ncbi:ParA family protein [Streptomyces kaniharaensis]|uniref:ParA family protein n=1 Tax=Streptomyces kaniharaensis TaxID=212423 RepID=A0A6N7L514_9ACTN|nr:ParA family protein [Streptomyces kaniharaensis]MQS17414.1 ParA family protein [Streptomyces kaniharaensis]